MKNNRNEKNDKNDKNIDFFHCKELLLNKDV